MKVEDALGEAMSAHVCEVHAPPSLGEAVRRRHRTRLLRFRTAGAALLAAAVAVAVPALNQGGGPATDDRSPAAGATGEITTTASARTLFVPNLVGMTIADAVTELHRSGFTTDVTGAGQGTGIVSGQTPGQGAQLPVGGRVTLSAQALLHDFDLAGRKFNGIDIGYVPDGLTWSKVDEKGVFGEQTHTTTFEIPNQVPSQFAVEVVVYKGQASEQIPGRLENFTVHGAQNVEINGKTAYLVNRAGDGSAVPGLADDKTVPVIGWVLRDGLAVEVYLSPAYARQIDHRAELVKIAEKIKAAD